MTDVVRTLEGLTPEGKPYVVIAHTTKGAGISFIGAARNGTTACQKEKKLNWRWRN